MEYLEHSTAAVIRALRSNLLAGYRKLTKKWATSEVLACTNLLLVAAIYGFLGGRIVTAIQFIIIPIVLLATVASAARDFIYPKSRFAFGGCTRAVGTSGFHVFCLAGMDFAVSNSTAEISSAYP
jgi:hypothetical protein